jgi:hypothetical protein
MTIIRRRDGYWITNIPECQDCGPYERKADAEEDRRGLERFFRDGEKPGYATTTAAAACD